MQHDLRIGGGGGAAPEYCGAALDYCGAAPDYCGAAPNYCGAAQDYCQAYTVLILCSKCRLAAATGSKSAWHRSLCECCCCITLGALASQMAHTDI